MKEKLIDLLLKFVGSLIITDEREEYGIYGPNIDLFQSMGKTIRVKTDKKFDQLYQSLVKGSDDFLEGRFDKMRELGNVSTMFLLRTAHRFKLDIHHNMNRKYLNAADLEVFTESVISELSIMFIRYKRILDDYLKKYGVRCSPDKDIIKRLNPKATPFSYYSKI
jgi:hypothetical protein